MKEEDIIEKYKSVFANNFAYIECDKGWYKIICNLCEDLIKIIKEIPSVSENEIRDFAYEIWIERGKPMNDSSMVDWEEAKRFLSAEHQFKICQIKEKFGGLRVYMTKTTEEIDNAIINAEKLSFKTCEYCGEPGKIRNDRSWIKTLCRKCYDEDKAKLEKWSANSKTGFVDEPKNNE